MSERFQLSYTLYESAEASPLNLRRRSNFAPGAKPLVSGLMVTHGNRRTLAYALDCFARQFYERRELIIVTDHDRVDDVTELTIRKNIQNVSIHGVGPELKLGDLRNIAVARSNGEVLMQWDDDDLYDPARITTAVAVLTQSTAAAALLERVLLWWPARKLAAISSKRPWEGSMAVWREHAPVYPSLSRGEDTLAVEYLSSSHQLSLYDASLLYVYTIHGGNTWDEKHFETLFLESTCVFLGDDYAELMDLLSPRLPVREYEAEINKA